VRTDFFELEKSDVASAARAGKLFTGHGVVHTPMFMPVGTQATVKAVSQQALRQYVNPDIILGNNYHLYLRPGSEVMHAAGGLHKFMSWDGPMLTDSGGYQVYSLSHNRKLSPEGVVFRSHIDGSKHLFTPENVLHMQRVLGSDIRMVLDECTPYPCEYGYAAQSLHLTHDWAHRAKVALAKEEAPLYGHAQCLFGIVQGSVYEDLRKESVEVIAGMDFDGNAIGGLAVGEPAEQMYDLTELCCGLLPPHKPRYLMGVGTPANILECIARGVDMMDCVLPSRNARHGLLFYADGIRNIKNARYKDDFSPIDPASECPMDQYYTKAYLRHLFIAEEYLAYEIATIHNLHFFLWLVRQARAHILAGTFKAWKDEMVPRLSAKL